MVNPLFEAPDEHWHFFTAEYIATTGKLPSVDYENIDPWLRQEAAQPPLYYLIGSLLIAPIDTTAAREQMWLNPFANIGYAAATANVNRAIQTPASSWPWHGFALAAHILRGFSTLLGLGTLICVYGSGRLLWPHQTDMALLATAMVAFLPQFNFQHAAITNDALITFLSACGLWQLLALWQHGWSRKRLLLSGITIGLAALSKNAGALLGLFSLGVLGLQIVQENVSCNNRKPTGNWHKIRVQMGETAVFVLLPVLLIAGWLWARNITLYHDWSATEPFIRIAGGDRHYTIWQVWRESGGLWTSFFAIFGWFNVRAPEWVYWIWNSIVLLALAGTVKAVIGNRLSVIGKHSSPPTTDHRSPITDYHSPIILLGWLTAVYAGLVLFMLRTEAAQGRLLFPAIVPLALGLSYGLSRWGRLSWAAPLLALITTLYALFFVIRPTYALPQVVDALPQTAVSLNADMGQGLTLVGAETHQDAAVPGDTLQFTLYWRAEQVPAAAPEFKLELLGRDLKNPIGALHSYHGRGLYPANLWPAGKLIADTFTIRLTNEMDTPVLARTFVRLVEDDELDAPQEAVHIGNVKISPQRWPELSETVLASVGNDVQITAVSLTPTTAKPGDLLTIDVTWQVVNPPGIHLTTLVHLAEAGQPPLAVGDNPPRQGSYPTTVWAAGEVIADQYTLLVPPGLENGRYPLWIGLYDSETIVPLPMTVDGVMQQDGRFLVGWVNVSD